MYTLQRILLAKGASNLSRLGTCGMSYAFEPSQRSIKMVCATPQVELVLEDVMDWPRFRHVERQARRLNDMIEKLDVDTLSLIRLRQGDAYAEARTKCLHCTNAAECLEWLENWPNGGEPAAFCPIITLLEGCRRNSSGRSSAAPCKTDHRRLSLHLNNT